MTVHGTLPLPVCIARLGIAIMELGWAMHGDAIIIPELQKWMYNSNSPDSLL